MSKVSAYYHIVFCTKMRRTTLPLDQCEHLYRFIWKEVTDRKCHLVRIGGIQDHVHMLIDLHPDVALSSLVRDIKSRTSGWLKSDSRFPYFEGWGAEYYAASVSASHRDAVIEYIKSQKEHHLHKPFAEELRELLATISMAFDDRDFR